jgi:hypothetical protein
MLRRCNCPTEPGYKNYGAKGIRVCTRWHSFENFLADVGERPSNKHSLGRSADIGHYEPDNVRWMIPAEQGHAKKLKALLFGRPYAVLRQSNDARAAVAARQAETAIFQSVR